MLMKCIISKQLVGRFFSTESHRYTEIKIPVPWGHIAGKWWGPQNKRPILTIHGWQDNCGSFNRLIPHLNNNLSFLAIDLPGHGLSSKLPNGISYEWIHYISAIRRVINYFNWSKVTFMAHSMGACMSYLYTVVYPNTVDFVIAFEGLMPFVHTQNLNYIQSKLDAIIKYDEMNMHSKNLPSYTIKELEEKVFQGTSGSIALENAKDILQRNIVPSSKEPQKFHVTRDLRLKVLPFLNFDKNIIMKSTSSFTCPALLCLGDHKHPYYNVLLISDDFYDEIKKVNKNFEIHYFSGTHHMHLNNPEQFGDFINNFIKKFDTEDRSVANFKSGL